MDIDIAIKPSRSILRAGSGLGIVATLTNNSDTSVYLREREVALAVPPEVIKGGDTTTYLARFPTIPHTKDRAARPDSDLLRLGPGAIYPVYFTLTPPRSTKGGWFARLLNTREIPGAGYYDFHPGTYQISVVAQYATDPSTGSYNVETATAGLDVAAPQSVILIGAGLGGMLAYILFPPQRKTAENREEKVWGRSRIQRIWRVTRPVGGKLWGVFLAVLWSALATVLISRLAQTQFIIQVSVVDFWGAITMGFITQYAGAKWLERYAAPVKGEHAMEEAKARDAAARDAATRAGAARDGAAQAGTAGQGATPTEDSALATSQTG